MSALLSRVLCVSSLVALLACESDHEGAAGDAAPLDAALDVDAGSSNEAAATGDGIAPTLVRSSPAIDERVYAHLRFDADGGVARRVIRATFSEPMDTAVGAIALDSGHDVRSLAIRWNADGTELEADVPIMQYAQPDGTTKSAELRYAAAYLVDLRGLRDRSGTPFAGDGVRFTTLPEDALLEHTCGHTIEPPYATLGLGSNSAAAPLVGLLHKRYVLAFANGTNEGIARLDVVREGPLTAYGYSLYTDAELKITASRLRDGAPISVASRRVPPVCAKLTHVTTIGVFEGDSYELSFVGDGKHTSFELYFERETP